MLTLLFKSYRKRNIKIPSVKRFEITMEQNLIYYTYGYYLITRLTMGNQINAIEMILFAQLKNIYRINTIFNPPKIYNTNIVNILHFLMVNSGCHLRGTSNFGIMDLSLAPKFAKLIIALFSSR